MMMILVVMMIPGNAPRPCSSDASDPLLVMVMLVPCPSTVLTVELSQVALVMVDVGLPCQVVVPAVVEDARLVMLLGEWGVVSVQVPAVPVHAPQTVRRAPRAGKEVVEELHLVLELAVRHLLQLWPLVVLVGVVHILKPWHHTIPESSC